MPQQGGNGTATSATGRTQHQESAFRALHGDGGFSSWERVLRAAQTHNRKEILSNACVELYRLAAKANVSHVQVADWATEQGFRLKTRIWSRKSFRTQNAQPNLPIAPPQSKSTLRPIL